MNDFGSTLIEEDQFYRVEFDEMRSLIHVYWKVHLEGEILKEKYLALLNIIKTFRPKLWLGNARAFHYTTLQDARWVFDYFIPGLIESSITKYARIESPRSLLLLDSENLLKKIITTSQEQDEVFEFSFFIDEGLALDWLMNS